MISIAHLKAQPGAWLGVPKIRALYEATYFAGLRKGRDAGGVTATRLVSKRSPLTVREPGDFC